MRSDNGFHPELRKMARFLPHTPVTPRTVWLMRALERLPIGVDKHAEVLTLTSGRHVRMHRPPGDIEPAAVLWIHGGGYVMGRPQQSDEFCRRLSRRLGIAVAAPSYRLAPEHPYPAAVDDLYAALQWLVSLPEVDASRVVIAGESGGGGLAAALAFVVRDRGEIRPALQLLSYPMLDDRTTSRIPSGHRLWNARINRFAWASYVGAADPDVAVPARRTDLAGLPPAWIGVGTADLFYDEDVAYAEALRSAGVPCHLQVVEGAFHGFDRVHAKASVARAFFDSQCTALRTALAL
ncbi:MAG: alpha/beta hydrolase [Mycobacteriaceae bacterium]|nr:alpha/beta hydrolase [Mycobacteriaceae bacterium]